MTTAATVLEVNDLEVRFRMKRKHLFERPSHVHAVDGISFTVERGRTLGLVGESGSGKTTTGLAIARLVAANGGSVKIKGTEVLGLEGEALRSQRQHMQFVFQDPYSALNPRLRAGRIVREALDRLKVGTLAERSQRVTELFGQVGLSLEQERLFPHQFSGGQRQRLGIARALASHPDLLICDEPVSALDVAVQAQILNLLRRLQQEMGLTYLFISHDLSVVRNLCDQVVVMYLGRVTEIASRRQLYGGAVHPYTKALMSAVPIPDPDVEAARERVILTGDLPSPSDPPSGCRFRTRCPIAIDECAEIVPEVQEVADGHWAACIRI